MPNIPAILLLEDGTSDTGQACGKIGTATGEICFNTSMTGYQELFTDPSYGGQLLITTNVHVGNYGIKEGEEESESEGEKGTLEYLVRNASRGMQWSRLWRAR